MLDLYLNEKGIVTDSEGNALAIKDENGNDYYLCVLYDEDGKALTNPDGTVKYYKSIKTVVGSKEIYKTLTELGEPVEASMEDEAVLNALKSATKADTKYILEQIRIEGEIKALIAKSNGENVSVTWKNETSTLAAALADIFTSITSLPTDENIDSKISDAIDSLVSGAPETYDTLKEIADYIESHESVSDALNAAIGNKVDKEEGKGLSAEDFTTALKTKLENLPEAIENASHEADGLMSKEDKTRLDGLRGIRYGTELPEDMMDGELFVRIVHTSV